MQLSSKVGSHSTILTKILGHFMSILPETLTIGGKTERGINDCFQTLLSYTAKKNLPQGVLFIAIHADCHKFF